MSIVKYLTASLTKWSVVNDLTATVTQRADGTALVCSVLNMLQFVYCSLQ